VNVEALIYEAYTIKDISTFTLYYFKSHLRIKINRIPINDSGGELPSSDNLLIFCHPGWLLSKKPMRRRYLLDIEFRQAHNYMLFNCDALRPFVQ